MKRRIPESWLSAYLDGELAADRAALVARFAAKNPAVARQLDELRRVKEAIASLPRARLAGDNRRRLWDAVLDHPELKAARKIALSAQMDDELSLTQSALLEASLTDDDLCEAGKLAEVRDALRELPKFIAPKDAVTRAMEQITFEAFEGVQAAAQLQELPKISAPTGLLEQAVCEMKPLASRRLLAFRREGWATGLATALLAGVALFAFTWSPPGIGEGLVAITRKPARNVVPATSPTKSPEVLAAEAAMIAAVDRPQMKAEPLDKAPLVDSDLIPMKKEPALPLDLPESLVELVRPGVKFEDPDTKFIFVCLDVKRMADRVQVVLLKHSVDDKNIRTKKENDGAIVSVELKATPEILARVLTDLKEAEEFDRLIAAVQVARPSLTVAKNEIRFKETPPVANVRPGVFPDSEPLNPPSLTSIVERKSKAAGETSPFHLEALPADQPRQYVLVFRRQDLQPLRDPKKG